MIDISVIIVNWNTKALLIDCVESLYRTTKKSSIEIIVVDNASTDDSVNALRNTFPQVQIIVNSDNYGFAKANNIGIMKARGHFICLVNSDVKALDSVLDKMRNHMEIHPEIGALAPKIYSRAMSIQKCCREFPTVRNVFCEEFLLNSLFSSIAFFRGRDMLSCDYDSIMEVEALSGCFLMVRREVVNQVGALDTRFFFYSEDVDWCKRIHETGWKLIHYPEAEAIHLGRGSSSNAPIRFQVEMLKANWQYWKKHKSMLECFLFWVIKFTGTLGRAIVWFAISLVASNRQSTAKTYAAAYGKMLAWLINLEKQECR